MTMAPASGVYRGIIGLRPARRRPAESSVAEAAPDCAQHRAPKRAAASTRPTTRRAATARRSWWPGRPRRASTPPCRPPGTQTGGAGRGRSDLLDIASRHRRAGKRHRADTQAQARRCDPGGSTISDPVAQKLAEWIILRSDDNGATVERYRAFLAANPSWPSQTFLRRRLEAALWDDNREDAIVWSWFENESPVSAKGQFVLARAMLARGDRANAERLVRDAWRNDPMSEEREHRARSCSARC